MFSWPFSVIIVMVKVKLMPDFYTWDPDQTALLLKLILNVSTTIQYNTFIVSSHKIFTDCFHEHGQLKCTKLYYACRYQNEVTVCSRLGDIFRCIFFEAVEGLLSFFFRSFCLS